MNVGQLFSLMNTEGMPNANRNAPVLSIAVNDPENYDAESNSQYQPPSLQYSAGPPPSIEINRHIPIGMMNNEHLAAEFVWLREVVQSDLENLGLSEQHIYAVLMAMVQDIRLSHPGFVPQM
jgi:hypothetical protein